MDQTLGLHSLVRRINRKTGEVWGEIYRVNQIQGNNLVLGTQAWPHTAMQTTIDAVRLADDGQRAQSLSYQGPPQPPTYTPPASRGAFGAHSTYTPPASRSAFGAHSTYTPPASRGAFDAHSTYTPPALRGAFDAHSTYPPPHTRESILDQCKKWPRTLTPQQTRAYTRYLDDIRDFMVWGPEVYAPQIRQHQDILMRAWHSDPLVGEVPSAYTSDAEQLAAQFEMLRTR